MILNIILLLAGLIILMKGANWLVDGSIAMARKFKVSDLAIGLTIVAFGTSTPELVVNAYASFQNYPDIVYGNIIGSNNFNIFVILGIAGLITPLTVKSNTVWKEIPFSLLAVIMLLLLSNDFFTPGKHILTRIDGLLLLLLFSFFLYYVFRQLRTDTAKVEIKKTEFTNKKIYGMVILGLIALTAGGQFVVSNAVKIAELLGISNKIIGLTILAAGTSLPELATSVTAAIKKNNDIAVGNIIGSNIFNIFSIMAASIIINPIVYKGKFDTELYFFTAGTIFLFIAMFTGQKKKLDRWEAAILLLSYIGYMIYIFQK
jgi:cation:H+ antiporter